ncbi:hypothetical protein [Caballeronia sp. dw_19]|uniref:hypothetical protein n=1 Tax=Caballeronia sp. dw_19 TaxID=2719791 RepID=UPI001BD5F5D8|nr:hypothetical protein [Caballeronia sp. dw_19]
MDKTPQWRRRKKICVSSEDRETSVAVTPLDLQLRGLGFYKGRALACLALGNNARGLVGREKCEDFSTTPSEAHLLLAKQN